MGKEEVPEVSKKNKTQHLGCWELKRAKKRLRNLSCDVPQTLLQKIQFENGWYYMVTSSHNRKVLRRGPGKVWLVLRRPLGDKQITTAGCEQGCRAEA